MTESTPHLNPMTHSRPLVRPAGAFTFGELLSLIPNQLKSPFEAERKKPALLDRAFKGEL